MSFAVVVLLLELFWVDWDNCNIWFVLFCWTVVFEEYKMKICPFL